MIILGIESSCDDTAVAVVRDGREVLAAQVNSQSALHARWGGIMPEQAARRHLLEIGEITHAVLTEAGLHRNQLDAVAVTQGPGLVGSLLIGASFAKGFALVPPAKPLIPVNHVHAHLFGALLSQPDMALPCLSLIVSGGHTNLYLMRDILDFELVSHSVDDACGEAFDKVAKMLGLGYPGGPQIEKMAWSGRAGRFPMPVVMKNNNNFSYSGLKTHVAGLCCRNAGKFSDQQIADLCYAFQEEAFRQLVSGIDRHLQPQIKSIVVAGGVAANKRLSELMVLRFPDHDLVFPRPQFCTDNAAMIAAMGYYLYHEQGDNKKIFSDLSWQVFSNYFQPRAPAPNTLPHPRLL